MRFKKALLLALVFASMLSCRYIVLPEKPEDLSAGLSEGWSGMVTEVSQSSAGDLHIAITVRNDTGQWSAMQAAPDKPATLNSGGKSTSCDTVFVSSGGHRLAPGFQMRGYIGGTKYEQETQLIYVECAGVQADEGTLSIDYSYVTGDYNYYEQEANKVNATMELDLSQVQSDLQYPMGRTVEGLVQPPEAEMIALNNVVLSLTGVERTEEGFTFTWQTENPGEYPSYVHVGNPPVIGEDGILYGYYETPDIVSVPVTPAGGTAEWTSEVVVPGDVAGYYIMLSVETGKQRLFTNYAVDITDK